MDSGRPGLLGHILVMVLSRGNPTITNHFNTIGNVKILNGEEVNTNTTKGLLEVHTHVTIPRNS